MPDSPMTMTDHQLVAALRRRIEIMDSPYDADLIRELLGRYEETRSERDEAIKSSKSMQSDLIRQGRTAGRISSVYRAVQSCQDTVLGQRTRIGQIMGLVDDDDQDDQIQRMLVHLDHASQTLETAVEELGDAALAASGSPRAQEQTDAL